MRALGQETEEIEPAAPRRKDGAVHKFLYGNTYMSTEQKVEHLLMLTGLVSIGYIGWVMYKELRK